MARVPTATVQLKLRIRESLRRQLEAAARKRDVSLNFEMMSRLEDSFRKGAERDLEAIVEDQKTTWARYSEFFERLELQKNIVEAMASDNIEAARAAAKLLLASQRANQ